MFSLEYLCRLWVCTVDEKYRHPLKGRLRYARTNMALIDLVAILPFYLPFIIAFDMRIIRLMRLVRLFRLLKVARYSESLQTFTDVYRLKRQELYMVFLAIMFLLIISSAVVYHLENEAQPDDFSSIPAAMWWGVATLTTVGYGDVTPVTTLGKFFGSIIALLGIGLFALPAGVLGSGFITIMRRKGGGTFKCPHCRKEVERGVH
jgi:voltage-gated potassium channel